MGQQQIEGQAAKGTAQPVMRTLEVDATCARYYRDGKEMPQAEEASARSRVAFDAVAELVEAATRANGDHSAPHDCYATGPLTGDPYRDLVECPGCRLRAALLPFQSEAES